MTAVDPRSRSTFGPWRYAFGVAAPVAVAGGIYVLLTPPSTDPVVGAGVIVLGLGFGFIFMAERVPLESQGVDAEVLLLDGGHRHAFVFRYSRARLTWFAIAAACFALLGLCGVLSSADIVDPGDEPALLKVAGGLIAVIGIAATIGLLRARKHSYIALTPEGLYANGFLGLVQIGWESITEAGVFEVKGERGTNQISLGVKVRDRSEIRDTKVLGVLSGFDRGMHGWDISFSVTTMAFDPRILHAAVERYRSDASARTNIGRREELETLKRMVQ